MVIFSNRLSVFVVWNIPRWFFFIVSLYLNTYIPSLWCHALLTLKIWLNVKCSWLFSAEVIQWWEGGSLRGSCVLAERKCARHFSLSLPPSTSSTIAFWLHFIFIVFFFAHFFVCFICKARVWTEFADPKSWIIYFGLMNSHRIYVKTLVMITV